MRESYLVTGSSGFIGTHVCEQAGQFLPQSSALYGLDIAQPANGSTYNHIHADIRSMESLASLPLSNPAAIIHLAARAEVLMPFEELADLSSTNVNGTVQVLVQARPRTFVFASSSAVYGSVSGEGVPTDFRFVKPVGGYGVSKLFGEMVCEQWCREGLGAAVAFRFGNVVGPQCRGLIPFLVRHALTHPEGAVEAQCKGRGLILRDYVPVQHIVELLWTAACRVWEPGTFRVFNAGTGRGMTNGQVGEIVMKVLREQGYRLNISWDAPLGLGESSSIVLGVDETVETFGFHPPRQDAVVASIEDAVMSWLARSPRHAAGGQLSSTARHDL
jgi:nucleoside-diphosphate-sugar epimerase